MDSWQLAAVIHECVETKRDHQKRIFAEHLLNERVAIIQAKPAYLAIVAGLLGTIAGACLNSVLQKPASNSDCVAEYQHGCAVQQKVAASIKQSIPAPVQSVQRVQNASQSNPKENPSHVALNP